MNASTQCCHYFPKKFQDVTLVDDNGYPTYRRRDDGRTIEQKRGAVDNRYVVPYNPKLLRAFHAHINVEKCNQSSAIKYLFKYISKGSDRVVIGISGNKKKKSEEAANDEIQQYLNCRYISSCEASWRAFGFPIHHRFPAVERLSFHLPNQQYVFYQGNEDVSELLENPRICESQFLSWMKINAEDTDAAKLKYYEFPNKYVYLKPKRAWKKRESGFSVGRMIPISPSAGNCTTCAFSWLM